MAKLLTIGYRVGPEEERVPKYVGDETRSCRSELSPSSESELNKNSDPCGYLKSQQEHIIQAVLRNATQENLHYNLHVLELC